MKQSKAASNPVVDNVDDFESTALVTFPILRYQIYVTCSLSIRKWCLV